MSSTNQETCSHFRKKFDLSDLELEHLMPSELKEMEGHFDQCDECRTWLADWQLIKLGTHELSQREVPAQVLNSIMSHIDPAPAPMVSRSDTVLAIAGLLGFLLLSILMGAESLEGTASWFVCFAMLFLLHGLTLLERAGATT